jgi:glycosyltransferase involved in cell wall biosynthesis
MVIEKAKAANMPVANIERAIKSVSWADEILVCDMHSEDNTALLAKKLGAIVFFHKRTGFVEPARNFAISKASHEWILVVDADEEVSDSLQEKLKDIIKKNGVVTHVEVPRKNIIFAKWMKAAGCLKGLHTWWKVKTRL